MHLSLKYKIYNIFSNIIVKLLFGLNVNALLCVYYIFSEYDSDLYKKIYIKK